MIKSIDLKTSIFSVYGWDHSVLHVYYTVLLIINKKERVVHYHDSSQIYSRLKPVSENSEAAWRKIFSKKRRTRNKPTYFTVPFYSIQSQ